VISERDIKESSEFFEVMDRLTNTSRSQQPSSRTTALK
jgi:hypothetical protein